MGLEVLGGFFTNGLAQEHVVRVVLEDLEPQRKLRLLQALPVVCFEVMLVCLKTWIARCERSNHVLEKLSNLYCI